MALPQLRLLLLEEIDSLLGMYETLNIYDLVFWENVRFEKWLKLINSNFQDMNFTYKPFSLYRPNKNFLSITFIKDGEEKEVKIPYREKFRWTWEEFINLIKEQLNK